MSLRFALFVVLALEGCRAEVVARDGKAPQNQSPGSPGGTHGLAVVELFTSEGCSSCPPADVVFGELAKAHPGACTLAFHVDYWDELGWPDSFASPAFTARQRAYATAFGSRSVYTPQMILNGIEVISAVDGTPARQRVERALEGTPGLPLVLRARKTDAKTIAVDYELSGSQPGAILDIVLIQRSATTAVRAGENADRTLHHENVVRALSTVSLPGTGSVRVAWPIAPAPTDGEVMGLVRFSREQAGGSSIVACARATLPVD